MKINKVTLLGHKDHGKSTLIGNLLIATKSTSKERIEEAEEISRKLGKKFEPAFILDSFYEERKGGLTIDTTRAQIRYKDMAFEFIDVPGHSELIQNMLSGASYANIAVLVISAKIGEGIKKQTERHLFIARMLGIKHLIIAVNKMDIVNYKKERFDEIKSEISKFLSAIGYEEKNVSFVPISAYTQENIMKKSKKMDWYSGKTLLEHIYAASKNSRKKDYGKSIALMQGYLENGVSCTVLSGKISRNPFYLIPGYDKYGISKIIVKGRSVKEAKTGVNAVIYSNKKFPADIRGKILCNEKIVPKKRFGAQVFLVNNLENPTLRFNGNEIKCNIKIKKVIYPLRNKTINSIKPLEAAEAEITADKALVTLPFDTLKELGRFTIYSGGKFSGFGTIKE